MHTVSCTNTHHDVTELVNHGMAKNTSRMEHNYSLKQKILNLCFRWHILRNYRFLAEVSFKSIHVKTHKKFCIETIYRYLYIAVPLFNNLSNIYGSQCTLYLPLENSDTSLTIF